MTSQYPYKLGALVMAKNESATIEMTLNSILGVVDCVCVLDTGSSDNTIEVVRTWAKKHKMPLFLEEEPFKDFSASRNRLMQIAEKHCDYQLHLDVNDVLQGGENLRRFVREYKGPASSFMVFQHWHLGNQKSIRFRNVRLCRSGRTLSYKHRVHEILTRDVPTIEPQDIIRIDTEFGLGFDGPEGGEPIRGFVIFQNRLLDNTKTLNRFSRDVVVLHEDHIAQPNCTRTMFYLAQTHDHLGNNQKALLMYQKRIEYGMEGFAEETLHAMLRSGILAERMHLPIEHCMDYYRRAVEFSSKYLGCMLVEPLLQLCRLYDQQKNHLQAFSLLRLALEENYPSHHSLFIDNIAYSYMRYHFMGRIAFQVGQYVIGGWCCVLALRAQKTEMDFSLLREYVKCFPHQDKWNDELIQQLLVDNMSDVKNQEDFHRFLINGPVVANSQPEPAVVVETSKTAKDRLREKMSKQQALRKKK